MQLPIVFRPGLNSLPPMYTWPRFAKQLLLGVSVLGVIAAYMLLAGGFVAVLAIAAERMTGG